MRQKLDQQMDIQPICGVECMLVSFVTPRRWLKGEVVILVSKGLSRTQL